MNKSLLAAILLATAGAACRVPDSLPSACTVDTDCLNGRSCVAGTCQPSLPDSGAPDRGPGDVAPPEAPPADTAPPDGLPTPPDGLGDGAEGEGEVVHFQSLDEVRTLLAGKWRRTGGAEPANLGGRPVEFTASGRWYELVETATGFMRQGGVGNSGQYTLAVRTGDAGSFTAAVITLTTDGLPSSLATDLAFTRNPERLAFGPAHYTRIPETQACENVGDVVQLYDVAGVRAQLVGRWRRCGGGEPANREGPVEFTADGKWYDLQETPTGFVRRGGIGKSGSYTIEADSADGGAFTSAQLTLSFDGHGSTLASNVAFTEGPRRMTYGPAVYAPIP